MKHRCAATTLTVASVAFAMGCPGITHFTQHQLRLDEIYKDACVHEHTYDIGGSLVTDLYTVGIVGTADSQNVDLIFYPSMQAPSVKRFDVPGVPVAVDKVLNGSGLMTGIVVATASGDVYNIENPMGASPVVQPIGSSGLFAITGVRAVHNSNNTSLNVLVYGQNFGPGPAAEVFVRQGNGTFTPGVFPQGTGPLASLAALDLDNDSDRDIVAALDAPASALRTFEHDGNGTYSTARTYPTAGPVPFVYNADLDGDGDDDVLVLTDPVNGVDGVMEVYRNDGDGEPVLIDSLSVLPYPTEVTTGDINGDGLPDAVVVHSGGATGDLLIFTGEPGGTFAEPYRVGAPQNCVGVAFTDVNDDGWVDIVATSGFGQAAVAYLGDGQRILGSEFMFLPPSDPIVYDFAVANFDNSPDNSPDVCTLSGDGNLPYKIHVGSWDPLNSSFHPTGAPVLLNAIDTIAAADLDGMNGPDLAAASPTGGVEILLNDGSGTLVLQTSTITGTSVPWNIEFALIDGNTSPDAVILTRDNTLTTWLNQGDATFTQGSSVFAAGRSMAITTDNDGTPRACVAHPALDYAEMFEIQSDGQIVLTDTVSIDPIEDISFIGTGDINGDGNGDFIAISADNPSLDVHLILFHNDGGGLFTPSVVFTGTRSDGWGPIAAGIGDVNGDGIAEILFLNDAPGEQNQFLGLIVQNETILGFASPIESFLAETPAGRLVLADLSNDGRVWMLSGQSGGRSGVSALPAFRPALPPPCPPDTNHDGTLSPADFTAWIAAFNTQAPECDQNDDGTCTPADFTAWISNYNAGC